MSSCATDKIKSVSGPCWRKPWSTSFTAFRVTFSCTHYRDARLFRAVSLIQHIPWIASLRMLIPGVGGKVRRTNKFARELVTERKTRGSMTKDLFHHLVRICTLSLRPKN